MQSFVYNVLRRHSATPGTLKPSQCRHVSLTGAIERGIRKGRNDPTAQHAIRPRRIQEVSGNSLSHLKDSKSSVNSTYGESAVRPDRQSRIQRAAEKISTDPAHSKEFGHLRYHEGSRSRQNLRKYVEATPKAIPYTTAGSEFLYGTFAVEAAIRAQRRRLYKLYIYCTEVEEKAIEDQNIDPGLEKRALAASIKVVKVGGSGWRDMLGRMAGGRPHNGVVLEASRIPQLPVTALERVHLPEDPVQVKLGHQSAEDQVVNSIFLISGSQASLPGQRTAGRYPLLLLLDRVVDTGNAGAILRSAYYLGADGVIVLEHGTAPLTANTVKASAGAAEYLPIIRIKDEVKFIKTSQESGWKFFAAVAPESPSLALRLSEQKETAHSINQALDTSPCVLMLGNEAEGLRPRLEKLADDVVSVVGAVGKHTGVDSLNVSVAAALLMRDFLLPRPTREAVDKNQIAW